MRAAKVEISAEEYKLFKALLKKHPELSGDVEAGEAPARKVMEVLNKAMKNPMSGATVDDFFDSGRGAQFYWDGQNKFVFEIVYDDVTPAAWGCTVTTAMLDAMDMNAYDDLNVFLDEMGVAAVDDVSDLVTTMQSTRRPGY